ncbi:MAG: signal recognition particle protein, partial [Verrucomicrobia bacterium]|nr:signal recognition particle protein [Verrucomicrobiota bacterium]MBT6788502.1 signal recognition particle protein [Verrucomicrobiota bacterium]
RIAAGSGTTVAALNSLLKRFGEMQKMMKKMGKFQKMMAKMGGAGAMPGMGKLLGR